MTVQRKKRDGDKPRAKRFRPLGLSIAILATAIGYGIPPLLPLIIVAWSQLTRRNVGVDWMGGTVGWFNVGLSVLILAASVFAWRGRPRGARMALLVLVWAATLIQVVPVLETFNRQAVPMGEVGGTFPGLPLFYCRVPLLVIIPLYVTWYLNRAPARAFFAGE